MIGSLQWPNPGNKLIVPGPVREWVESKERDGVGVDGQGYGRHADNVHDQASLHIHCHGYVNKNPAYIIIVMVMLE